jgi:hypothetical protein
MNDYHNKLKRLAAQPLWKRKLFEILVNALIIWKHITDFYHYLNVHFPRRRFVVRTAPRWHYLGYPRQRPPRIAFLSLTAVLTGGTVIASEPIAIIQWSLGWGVIFSAWVFVQSTYRVLKYIRS